MRSNGAVISISGAQAVARRALTAARFARVSLPAVINGAVGVINAAPGRPISIMAFTISGAKIVAIDLIDDPGRIAEADLDILGRPVPAGAGVRWLPAHVTS